MSEPKLIYHSRAQCKECNLDKDIMFYRVPNGTPTAMHNAHKKVFRQRFRDKYGCTHKIEFSRIIDKEYVYDVETNTAIKREGL